MVTKLDILMFQDESWIHIYFGVKTSKVKIISCENIVGMGLCLCTLVSPGFFCLSVIKW